MDDEAHLFGVEFRIGVPRTLQVPQQVAIALRQLDLLILDRIVDCPTVLP